MLLPPLLQGFSARGNPLFLGFRIHVPIDFVVLGFELRALHVLDSAARSSCTPALPKSFVLLRL